MRSRCRSKAGFSSPAWTPGPSSTTASRLAEKPGSSLDTLAQQAGLQPAQWDACVVEGEAWQCIVEQEEAHDCDLGVVGKHGQSAAEELLLGSVTKSVLAEGSCDVLVSMARAN